MGVLKRAVAVKEVGLFTLGTVDKFQPSGISRRGAGHRDFRLFCRLIQHRERVWLGLTERNKVEDADRPISHVTWIDREIKTNVQSNTPHCSFLPPLFVTLLCFCPTLANSPPEQQPVGNQMETGTLVLIVLGFVSLVVTLAGLSYSLGYRYFLGLNHSWLIELNTHMLPQLWSPGAQHSSPGKIIVKYFLKTFMIESCYNFCDQCDSYSKTVIKIGVWSLKYLIDVRATLTLSSLVTEGRTTLSNRAIQLHPKLILPC